MNVLTTTWRQLVRRRLWPVAVLLVAALAAVPVLLSHDPAPVTPPEQPASAPAEQSAKADDALAEPVVAKASADDRSRRRRVLGVRKDPFTPAAAKKKHKAVKKVKKTKAPAITKQEPTSSPSTPAPSTPSTPAPATPVAPAPPKKVYEKDSLIVRFGDAAQKLKRMNVKKLAALPNDADADQLLVYMGLTDHGKKAVFMVDESLEPSGDADCKPHPSNCETIELAVGETEFFDVVDAETGNITSQFQLDLVDIK